MEKKAKTTLRVAGIIDFIAAAVGLIATVAAIMLAVGFFNISKNGIPTEAENAIAEIVIAVSGVMSQVVMTMVGVILVVGGVILGIVTLIILLVAISQTKKANKIDDKQARGGGGLIFIGILQLLLAIFAIVGAVSMLGDVAQAEAETGAQVDSGQLALFFVFAAVFIVSAILKFASANMLKKLRKEFAQPKFEQQHYTQGHIHGQQAAYQQQSVNNELTQLDYMYRNGQISRQEYEARRNHLLSRR